MKKAAIFLYAILSIVDCLHTQITVGLFDYTDSSFDGYTLIAPMRSQNIYLIDNCGEKVHQWVSESNNATVAYLLEDGSLIRSVRKAGDFFGGGITGGIEHLDWDSNLLWSYDYTSIDYHHHHDFEVLPNGDILVLAWERIDPFQASQAGRLGNIPSGGVWPEHIVQLHPEGIDQASIVWEWHLWDHIIQDVDMQLANHGQISENPQRVNINYGGNQSDWIHANSIDYNSERDEILINSRNFNEFWVIDHSTTTEEAASSQGGNSGQGGDILYRWGNPATYGLGSLADQQMSGQHDAHWIPQGMPYAGNIMVFNNGQSETQSNVLIIEPPLNENGQYALNKNGVYGPNKPLFEISGDPNNTFSSDRVSGAQMLPNGNVLVCAGNGGLIQEFSLDNILAWKYINPQGEQLIEQGSLPNANALFRAYRYDRNYSAFTDKVLEAQGPIELNPVPNNCMLFTSIKDLGLDKIKLLPSIVEDYLFINIDNQDKVYLTIYDQSGQVLLERKLIHQTNQINLSQVASGIYICKLTNEMGQQISSRFIKN